MLLWSVSLSPIVFHIPYYPSHQKKAFISVFIILNFIWKHKECSLFVISHYINQDSSIDNPHFFYFPVETYITGLPELQKELPTRTAFSVIHESYYFCSNDIFLNNAFVNLCFSIVVYSNQ